MHKGQRQSDLQHLVLLGGGHAQVSVLKDLAMHPLPGLRITLISRDILTPYSGMLPGYIEGCYRSDEITIDLSHLARHAGARLIHAEVSKIDPDARTITIPGRPPLHYDLLSINIGSTPDPEAIAGAAAHATPIKPISTLLDRFDAMLKRSEGQHIAIIGGGAAGVETALALEYRLQGIKGSRISIYHRGPRLVPEYPLSAARYLAAVCGERGIDVHCGVAVDQIAADHLILGDGSTAAVDHALIVTAGSAPGWLAETGLDLDENGFIAVRPTLQSTSHEDVFATGDIANLGFDPRPKAGVFAVRGGKPLARNIRRRLLGQKLENWQPQKNYLALIGTGGGAAVAVRGGLSLPTSRAAWWLKEWIDRAFITKFSDLPEMPVPPPALLARDIDNDGDPALADMRCLGCGAKAGYGTLHDALSEAGRLIRQKHPESRPFNAITSDSSEITLDGAKIIQSVDAISALVDDPFVLGMIAARHAMSDLFASNADPKAALAIITLPSARRQLQQDDISQLMTGAMLALHEDGAVLTGGHTSEGETMQIGFAISGTPHEGNTTLPKEGDVLILTKPLGSGVIMAAHGQGMRQANGQIRANAIATMAQSSGHAARMIRKYGNLPMTDVTGFGLARHTLSLLSRGDSDLSATFNHAALPLMAGAQSLIDLGVRSSLHAMNSKAAPVIMETSDSDVIYHDPQTGGGLLVAVTPADAERLLADLTGAGISAASVGRINADGAHQIRVQD